MKKFLIFLSIVLLLGAGYFTYDQWIKNADLSNWSFIPDNSLMVYESNTSLRSLQEIQQTDLWTNLAYVPSFRKINNSIDLLDSISVEGAFINKFGQTNTLIALNNTGSSSFDFLFVVDLKNLSQQTFINEVLEYFSDSGAIRKSRTYDNVTITEISVGAQTFSFILYKHYFVGSFSAFLVEDAIRTVQDGAADFQSQNPELITLTKLARDQGNLYFNAARVADVLSIFSTSYDFKIAKSAFMDLKVANEFINLNGFTFTNDDSQYLNIFKGIESGGFDILEIIPTNTSWFYHISAAQPASLGESLMTYYQQESPETIALQQDILRDYDFDINYTYRLLDDEMAVLTLEGNDTKTANKLLILEVNDMSETLRYFGAVAEREFAKTGDSIYVETYDTYSIQKLPVRNYPKALLNDLGEGFEDIFYLPFRNYLVMSSSPDNLKRLIVSIENENTWTKSISINDFLEQTNQQSCLSFFMNTSRAWRQMTAGMKPEWKDFFKDEEVTFRNLDLAAFQFSALDDKFYTNITLYQPSLPNRAIPESINTLHSITLPSDITSKPWIVTNHNNKQREVLVQDSSYQLFLIGTDFSALWDIPIKEPIIGTPIQVDYYKNGKLQYAFATESAVHIIDRTGKYLPEFPKGLSKVKIKDFNVIDYDNSKKYRFAITDDTGKMYLTDKNVKPLKGWNPKKFKSALYQAPIHKRIAGKDVFVIVEETGKVSLLDRRGRSLSGFPINIESSLASTVQIRTANSLNNTAITLLNTNGEVFEYSFTGKVLKRDQLYKPAVSSQFQLISNTAGNGYKMVRITENQIEILDQTGITLFTKEFNEPESLHFQYYELGAGKEFIVIVDPLSAYLYFYNLEGNLLTGSPLAATNPIALMQYDNSYRVYRVIDNALEVISVSF